MIERDPRLPAPAASALHGESGPTVAEVAEVLGLGAEPAKPADRHGRRPAWFVALVTVGVLVGIIIIVFIKFVNGPVSAGALASTPTPTTKTVALKTGTGELGGLTFDLTYPAIFDQMKQLKNDPQDIEQYYLTSTAEYSRSLAIAVRKSDSNMVEDDASYKLRSLHPAEYKERRDKMNGEPLALMMKTDNTEATLFWVHEGKLLTVSILSTKPTDSVADLLNVVETSLRWKK